MLKYVLVGSYIKWHIKQLIVTNEMFGELFLTLSRLNYLYIIYKNSYITSQETRYVSITKTHRLMLFREKIAVNCENHKKHTNTVCRQNAQLQYIKACGIYHDLWALKS
jgi:hypothetical protein